MSAEHQSPERRPQISPDEQEWLDLSPEVKTKHAQELAQKGYAPVEALSFGIIDKDLQERYQRKMTMHIPNLISSPDTRVTYTTPNGKVHKPALHCVSDFATVPNHEEKAFILIFAGHLFASKSMYRESMLDILGKTSDDVLQTKPVLSYMKNRPVRPLV